MLISYMYHSQKGRASPGLLLAPIAAQQGWVQGVTGLATKCDRIGYKVCQSWYKV